MGKVWKLWGRGSVEDIWVRTRRRKMTLGEKPSRRRFGCWKNLQKVFIDTFSQKFNSKTKCRFCNNLKLNFSEPGRYYKGRKKRLAEIFRQRTDRFKQVNLISFVETTNVQLDALGWYSFCLGVLHVQWPQDWKQNKGILSFITFALCIIILIISIRFHLIFCIYLMILYLKLGWRVFFII